MDAGSSHDPGASAPPELLPKHTIFLSHSGREKPFVQELNESLRLVNHSPFFDQNEDSLPKGERFPDLIFRAAKQCQVAVIVLSEGYLTSKWPMLELVEFHKSMKDGNPIKLLPVFYMLKPDQIEKSEYMEKWFDLFKHDEELVKKCKDAVHALKAINGLIFEKYGGDHFKYKKDVVRKICKLRPPPHPFDTSDMQGCDRLCKLISELFKEHNGIHYLGIYGLHGSGKSKQCQAMCNYYSEEYPGRYCIVDLDDDKVTDIRAKEKREKRLRIAIEQIGCSNEIKSYNNLEEAQLRKYLKDHVPNERVFFVVENVSQSSAKEAEFYVQARYAHGSRVLLTSRNRSILEKLLGGPQYSDFCQPVPALNNIEAIQLFLAKGAPSRSIQSLQNHEYNMVSACCAKSSFDGQYHPSYLIAVASYFERSIDHHEIANWDFKTVMETKDMIRDVFRDVFRYVLLEYDNNLSRTAKLIFLDLVNLSDVCMLNAYIDKWYPSWQWPERLEYTTAIDNIACVHDLSPGQVESKVKELQEMSFLTDSTTEVAMPEFYIAFAWFLRNDDNRDESNWFWVWSEKEEYCGHRRWAPETVTRLRMVEASMYNKDPPFPKFTKLVYLELERVEVVQELDLQGLSSLRVMKVKECKDLKKIFCRCSRLKAYCYLLRSNRMNGCLKELRAVQLEDLPNLESVSFAPHCSNLISLWIYDCPKVEDFYFLDLRHSARLSKSLIFSSGCGEEFLNEREIAALIEGLEELVIRRGQQMHRFLEEKTAKKFLKSMMESRNLRVLDIGHVMPASIESINVSKLVNLCILDLSGAKMTRIDELCKLLSLRALGLYDCSELLEVPNLAILTKLRNLCISHCYKLAHTFSKEAVPHGVKNFHALGDKCNLDAHECLNPGW